MALIQWIEQNERVVGRNHPTLTDVTNRPLRQFLAAIGLDPDADITSVPVPSHTHAFADLTGKPTTLGGYGITDAYTASAIDTLLAGKSNVGHTHVLADVSGAQATIARGDVQVVTETLANQATEEGTISLGKSGVILKAVASAAAWVRLYTTAADRTADSGRTQTEDPEDGIFVLADYIFAADLLTIREAVNFMNSDGPVAGTIYYSIRNISGASAAITVTFTRIVLEN